MELHLACNSRHFWSKTLLTLRPFDVLCRPALIWRVTLVTFGLTRYSLSGRLTFPPDLLSGWRHGRSLRSLPDVPAVKTVDFLNGFNKKSIPFQSRPLLAACSRTSRHPKPLIFLLILIRNRYFFSPGRSLPLAPGCPGTRNR